ncbi:hypothetical protein [Inquilinus sp. OTU3971]|uniref:hypothetical protein n=1 Tax=Inquilinus sp. OTU3971 TaxID=3043855 RepID=UPI00313ED15C
MGWIGRRNGKLPVDTYPSTATTGTLQAESEERGPAWPSQAPIDDANTTAGPWFARITPYAWLPSVSGSTGGDRRVPSLSIGQSFSGIPSDRNFAGMIAGTVHGERIGLLVDYAVRAKSSR